MPIPEFDTFRPQVDIFIKLRVAAENAFRTRRHIAKARRDALPLDWAEIKPIVFPGADTPFENLVTKIARECLAEAEDILRDLRKVLVREREKVALGMVQQVDAHCLRWLSKQPGRDKIEKAGAKQRILAVIRREDYNTLENRVFKDFLARAGNEAAQYLHEHAPTFKDHETIKRVRRLHNLSKEGEREPLLSVVGGLRELPLPNYVLRQERRYSKIWKAYVELVRHAAVAERLWARRDEVQATLARLKEESAKHTDPGALYKCPVWFNVLDGKHELLDKPFYKNKKGKTHSAVFCAPSTDDVIVDLSSGTLHWDLLIYGAHDNAKPYLQDYVQPSIEDLDGREHYYLYDLFGKPDPMDEDLRKRIRDYFEQLYAKLGGKRWFILVPDEWEPRWQEAIIKSIPLARNNVFLLWRSVAALLGSLDKLGKPKDNDLVAIVDFRQGGVTGLSLMTLAANNDGVLIPQRKSYVRHRECYGCATLSVRERPKREDVFLRGIKASFMLFGREESRVRSFIQSADHIVQLDCAGVRLLDVGGVVADAHVLERGVLNFIRKRDKGKTAYYDELEALSLIVQTPDERIEAKELVEADEKFPGGLERVMERQENAARLMRESDYVDLLLCMGDVTPDVPLKIKRHHFGAGLSEEHSIHLSARITPGQGMAIVTVESDFLREPIELDFLNNMFDFVDDDFRPIKKNGKIPTLSTLENIMQRSFPPDSPDVIADYGLWTSGGSYRDSVKDVRSHVKKYLAGAIAPDGKWFAQATRLYPDHVELPANASPLERLRRKNVFGNDPQHRTPEAFQPSLFDSGTFDFQKLFKKLADDYRTETDDKGKDQLARLIAWTYQSDYSGFKTIRRQVVKRVLAYAKDNTQPAPLFQELTLCANLCTDAGEWSDCLRAINYRISNHENKVSRDFYLLYNLLQFHPTILRDTGIANSDACWMWVQHIPYWYGIHSDGRTTIGYILKSLLYFLRCRRFDGRVFLTRERDAERYDIIANCLAQSVHSSHEKLRELVIDYLDGKGTIDGLPVD